MLHFQKGYYPNIVQLLPSQTNIGDEQQHLERKFRGFVMQDPTPWPNTDGKENLIRSNIKRPKKKSWLEAVSK